MSIPGMERSIIRGSHDVVELNARRQLCNLEEKPGLVSPLEDFRVHRCRDDGPVEVHLSHIIPTRNAYRRI